MLESTWNSLVHGIQKSRPPHLDIKVQKPAVDVWRMWECIQDWFLLVVLDSLPYNLTSLPHELSKYSSATILQSARHVVLHIHVHFCLFVYLLCETLSFWKACL